MCAEICRKIVPDGLESGNLVEGLLIDKSKKISNIFSVWDRKRDWQVDRSITLDQFFVGETTPTEADA